jgi:hypothetical protein
VPKTCSTSCDQVIFVDQATDLSVFSDAVQVEIDRLGQWLQRRGAVQETVRPVLIVGPELAQDSPQMGLVPDEATVQEFASASADPAFGDRVHAGRLDAAQHGPDASVGEDCVERAGEVDPRSRIMNLTRCAWSPMSIRKLRACWAVHCPVGCRVTPRIWMRRVACSITARTLWGSRHPNGLICPAWTRGQGSRVRRASGCVPSLNLRKG